MDQNKNPVERSKSLPVVRTHDGYWTQEVREEEKKRGREGRWKFGKDDKQTSKMRCRVGERS
jgi:hypothetical protein